MFVVRYIIMPQFSVYIRVIENVFDRVIYDFFMLLCYFDLCYSEVPPSKQVYLVQIKF